MTQLTQIGLVKILGQVSVIMVVPMIGAAIVGIALDRPLGTTPLLSLIGFGLGNLVAFIGLGLYIRAGRRKLRRPPARGD